MGAKDLSIPGLVLERLHVGRFMVEVGWLTILLDPPFY